MDGDDQNRQTEVKLELHIGHRQVHIFANRECRSMRVFANHDTLFCFQHNRIYRKAQVDEGAPSSKSASTPPGKTLAHGLCIHSLDWLASNSRACIFMHLQSADQGRDPGQGLFLSIVPSGPIGCGILLWDNEKL